MFPAAAKPSKRTPRDRDSSRWMYPLLSSACNRSETVFVDLMRNFFAISRMLGWYVFSARKSIKNR